MDYGKFQYEKDKDLLKQKKVQKKIETKGIRLSFRISIHDRDVRLKQALKFLNKGHKVKIEMIIRGRENAYKGNAIEMIKQFIADVQTDLEFEIQTENIPKKEGGRITALISRKK